MAIQRSITLPALTPSAWELRLPDYPVITSRWRGSDFPELLGSLPNGARWSLSFDSMTNAEALALLLPWRATAGGQWALSLLPGALAGGVDNADFRKRLTGTTWSIASEPRKEPVKNGRFNVTIELVHELDFNSLYGPLSSFLSLPTDDVLALQIADSLAIAALPTQFYRPPRLINNEPIVSLSVADELAVAGTGAVKLPRELNAQATLSLDTQDSLAVAALPASFSETIDQFTAQASVSLNVADDLEIAASSALFAKIIPTRASEASIDLNVSESLAIGGIRVSLFKQIPETTAEELLLSGITLDSIELGVSEGLQIAGVNPTKIRRADLTLALDIAEDLDAIAEPIELFAASRVRSADALALLNESSNLSVAALPTGLFRGDRIKSAGTTLSLNVARGLDPIALPTSFSPKPIQQFTAQSALNLDIVLGVDAIALPASFDKRDPAQFTAQLALDLDASRELSVAAVGPTR